MNAIVLPSGAALTSAAVPVMPPAPGRFSITTAWPPSLAESAGPTLRTMTSTPEPGLTGRMTRSGGRSAACACARQRPAHAEPAAAERDRQQHDVGRAAVVGRHRHEAAALLQVAVVDELLGLDDRRVRQTVRFELGDELGDVVAREDRAEPRDQLGARMDALLVGRQP